MKLYRYTIYNALGLGLPLIVAFFTIPYLLQQLGNANFGILTLIWALVSYFGLFDLGLGRAMTQIVAPLLLKDGELELQRIGEVVFNGCFLLALLGVVTLVALVLSGDIIIENIDGVVDHSSMKNTVLVMALTMPAIMLTNGLKGVLEANNDFALVNYIRLPMGIWTFIGPFLICYFYGPDLFLIMIVLSLGRWWATIAYAFIVGRLFRQRGVRFIYSLSHTHLLVSSGGWMAVSNIISSLMGYLDRFIIAFSLSALAVSYYAIPHEMITKLWVIPAAITTSIFPTFSKKINFIERSEIIKKVLFLNFISIVPICVVIMFTAKYILALWIDDIFSDNSYLVLVVLAFGMAIGSFASVPYTALQAMGYQKVTARIHLIELFIFVGIIYFFTIYYGVIGSALAWTSRAVIDSFIMFYFYDKYNKRELTDEKRL